LAGLVCVDRRGIEPRTRCLPSSAAHL
jgi:hypothetical protein